MDDLKSLIIEKYLKWIKDNTFLKELDKNTLKIVSPFLDSRNDYIRLYVKRIDSSHFQLSDGGYLISDLDSTGIRLTDKRRELFDNVLSSYGLKHNDETSEIYIVTDLETIGKSKHMLIQGLVTLNDFFNFSEQNVKEIFFYDVYNKFIGSNVPFTPNIYLKGTSGYDHKIDFSIGVSQKHEEVLIKLVASSRQKQFAENCIFSFIDIQRTSRKFKAMVIYKGPSQDANKNFLDAFEKYGIEAHSWEEREEIIKEIMP